MDGSRSPLCWWQAPCSQCWLPPYLSLLVITAHSRPHHFAPKIYLRLVKPVQKQVKSTKHSEQSWHEVPDSNALSSKQQKQLVLERNKSTDIHTTLHAVANCALSNEQTTFSDSLISKHTDPCHAHSSSNEPVIDSKFKWTTTTMLTEQKSLRPIGWNLLHKNTSPFLGWPLQTSK